MRKITPRRYFTPFSMGVPLPDLIEVQKRSYAWFLKDGIRELFEEISSITPFNTQDYELSFTDYYFDEAKFDEIVSREKQVTYEAALRVKAVLKNNKTGEVKKQEVFLGDFPLMTKRGTFIINGVERVVVSQIVRSAGVLFTSQYVKGKRHYGTKVIPNRGAWLEFETDSNHVIWVKIDRKRKVAATSILRAFGYGTDKEILELFRDIDTEEPYYIQKTLEKDAAKDEAEGLKEVYKRIRPGDLAATENIRQLIYSMFFRLDRYDLDRVGRYKMNLRFGKNTPIDKEHRVLMREDIVDILKEIIRLNQSQIIPDDIDHLGNRRVRAVGEQVQNKLRIGLARMSRIVKDRMSTLGADVMTPARLVNPRPIVGVTREFFMSSQLSQFMDQTNPLAELEHKRRLSAMGPGGLTKERAGFEVRDVHPSHYGRICPIATPEGPNIGLVGHLASFAHVNEYGFLETPYLKVIKEKDGRPRVSTEVEYLDAFSEEKYVTCSASAAVDKDGYFLEDKAEVRRYGEPSIDIVENIDYMDVAPFQMVSVGTALIPFLEHDDGNRALMGSNMQRQSVPCIKPESPIIGTGIEEKAARDSGQLLVSDEDGVVTHVSAESIRYTTKKGEEKQYRLNKFVRSNQSTCLNHRPLVSVGDAFKKNDILADGAATDQGDMALGQNLLTAYMIWDGYNFEDAVILSERVVEDDRFTSIYVEDHEMEVRDTKLGPEIVTADIPNISEEKLKDLDEDGIVRIGAEVHSGSILVGKITPKGETELSAEEKLLRAIFGEKARDVRDSSLYLEHGGKGKVVDVKIFSREEGDKLPAGVMKKIQVSVASLRKIQVGDKIAGRHGNKGVISKIVPIADMPFLEDGTPVDIILTPLGVISRMNLGQLMETHLGLAAYKLGYRVATPVLRGVTVEQIQEELRKAGLPEDGKLTLFDGRSGETFEHRVAVGMSYILKLNHMVEDKIHQRSIGPYSLITQQPLGGKAQLGGQRFGEMEVWAIEGYGAAHTLQEILTIKSDDVIGRSKAYEAIIKGEEIERINIPESFNVLVRELKGLCLDVELLKDGKPFKGE